MYAGQGTLIGKDHCTQCGSDDRQDIEAGTYYSNCCGELICRKHFACENLGCTHGAK